MTLNVGHIAYLNCVPFFHYLREVGFEGNIVKGVPAQLNAMLAEGKLDLSPSSSFEYGLHWQQYVLLPGLSISSRGPVQSVLLFSPCAIEDLEGRQVALTGESATSVNLLKILLKEFVKFIHIYPGVFNHFTCNPGHTKHHEIFCILSIINHVPCAYVGLKF